MSAIIRKISTKTVVGNLKAIVLNGMKEDAIHDGDVLDVMTVLGIVKKYNEGEHAEYGTFFEFVGQFESESLIGPQSGESFRAPKCFLPEAATELLVNEINTICEIHDGEMKDVQVAVKIQVRVDESANTNYVFQVVPLIEVEEADPLLQLKNKVRNAEPVQLEHHEENEEHHG